MRIYGSDQIQNGDLAVQSGACSCTRQYYLVTTVALLLLIVGCAGKNLGDVSGSGTTVANSTADPCANFHPRIHSIGTSKILTFDPPLKNDPSDDHQVGIEIVIEGQDLFHKECFRIGAKVSGTRNAILSQDFGRTNGVPGGGSFTIKIYNRYLENAKTGDQLEVFIVLQPTPNVEPEFRQQFTTNATRRFTLYTTDDYRRKILSSRIEAGDINAFPLPEKEAKRLFGPVISNNFFTVRLSIRNATNEDKLVSTGMIIAHGRMIVKPHEHAKGFGKILPFTIPVEMSPQSLEQTYTMVDDADVGQPRSVVFRSLEFVGALATGITTAFFSSLTTSQALGIFTGIAIPEGRKLWTDPWPRYKRNIVAFAMPDLLKVPQGSIAGHKYIFFSKNKLDAIVSDQNLFGNFNDGKIEQPNVAIAQVQFYALDIPFEKVFTVEAVNFQDRVATLREELPALITSFKDIDRTWKEQTGSRLLGILKWEDLNDLTAQLKMTEIATTKQRQVDEAATTSFGKARRSAVDSLRTLENELTEIARVIDSIDEDGKKPLDAPLLNTIKNKIASPLTSLASTSVVTSKLSAALKALATLEIDPTIYPGDAALLGVSREGLARFGAAFNDVAGLLNPLAAAPKREEAVTLVKKALDLVQTVTHDTLMVAKQVNSSRTTTGALADQITALLAVAEGIKPDMLRQRMLGNTRYGLSVLEEHLRTLRSADIAITRGAETSSFNSTIDKAKSAVKLARRALDFTKLTSEKFADGKQSRLAKLIAEIEQNMTKQKTKQLDDLVASLRLHYVQLFQRAHEGLGIVPVLSFPSP